MVDKRDVFSAQLYTSGTDCDHATYMLTVLHFNIAVIFFCSSLKFQFLLPQMQKGSWPTPLKDTVCQRCPMWLLEEKKLGLMLRHDMVDSKGIKRFLMLMTSHTELFPYVAQEMPGFVYSCTALWTVWPSGYSLQHCSL